MTFPRSFAVAALLILLACTPDSPGLSWSGRVETEAGATVVFNPDAPVLPAGAITATRMWTTPSGDVPDWAEPVEVVQGDGEYFVLDRRSTRIHVVTVDGQLLRSFGKKGAGPGELQAPGHIGFVDGNVVVRDMGRHTLEIYAPTGELRGSVALGRVGFGFYTIGADAVIVARMAADGQRWDRMTLDGDETEIQLPGPGASDGGDICQRVSTIGDRIAQLDCVLPVLTVSSQQGVVERVIRIASDTLFASEENLLRLRQELERDISAAGLTAEMSEAMFEQFARDMRVIKRFQATRHDHATGLIAIWEQVPPNLGGGNAVLRLLSPDGIYLARLEFDEPWMGFTMHDSHIAALAVEAATGLPRLTRYAVSVPEGILNDAATILAAARER